MIYNNLHGILATRIDGLIGDADRIPWHHSGDLKHFKRVTTGAALIIGVKTFVGIANHYFKENQIVLPGRHVFVSFNAPVSYWEKTEYQYLMDLLPRDRDFDWPKIYPLPKHVDPRIEIQSVMAMMGSRNMEARNIFIAGGAATYDRYLPFANDIYMTLITETQRSEHVHPVYLSESTQKILFKDERPAKVLRTENEPGISADFFVLSRKSFDDIGKHTEPL